MNILCRKLLSYARPYVERFPAIAAAYRAFRDQRLSMRAPMVTPWGFTLNGNEMMASGAFEPAETALVRRLLGETEVFVNIGANIGYYCSHALNMGKAVVAFEPMQQNLRLLCQNVKNNGWQGIEVYPLALSSHPGVIEIYGADTGASMIKGWAGTAEKHVTMVPASTLDLVLGPRLLGKSAFVLMDVEGAELGVLQGAVKVLGNEPKPIWMIEIVSSEHQPKGVTVNPNFARTFQIMWEAGYTAVTADSDMREVTRADVDAVQAGDVQRLSTHNFLFK